MSRIALGIEYDGTGFLGWQRQAQSPTVQECLEIALSAVADTPVTIHCAGRTDSGVHAAGQVAHFDTTATRSMRSWVLGTNTNLPEGIALRWAMPVADEFDARRCATSRRYEYYILNRWSRPALGRSHVTWIHHPLDASAMHEAAQALVGEHDFTSFRSVHCQAKHARRCLTAIDVTRLQANADMILIAVTGNAFLHHMVRNIAGTLMAIGQGKQPVAWAGDVLAARDRTLAGITAPASGLTLVEVGYPSRWGLPAHPWPSFPSASSQQESS